MFSKINQHNYIKQAKATIAAYNNDATATVSCASGYDKTNTLILGIEFGNSAKTIINTMPTNQCAQLRWTAAGTGIYCYFQDQSLIGGTVVVYYCKFSNKTWQF